MDYRRADGMTWDLADDRAVILDAQGATLITLNPVGTLLWVALDEPRPAGQLTAVLAEHFPEVDEAQLRADVDDFLDTLLAEGLVVDVSAAA
jgi:hypothetical protein